METAFTTLAPRILRDLITTFPTLSREDAAAIVGNLAHESAGFAILQERHPLVAGSAGGYGWAQWTGPRRRAFFAWAAGRQLSVSSYEANFGFLVEELRGAYSRSLVAVRAAKTLDDKVAAFEASYEAAGIKHMDSRRAWARKALALAPVAAAAPAPAPRPAASKPTAAPAAPPTLGERLRNLFFRRSAA